MVAQYSVELDRNRHPIMVCEREIDGLSADVSSPDNAVQVLQEVFHAGNQAEEHVYLISLDTRKQVLGLFDVCHGQVGGCAVGNREIFLRILVSGGCSMIVAHNHPSGNLTPSAEDFDFTNRLREAGDLLGIHLDDSLIISNDGIYYSFMQEGRLP